MVADGVTVQVTAVAPAQFPPVHTKEVAVGMQLAVRVDDAPAVMDAGVATSVHTGLAGVTATVALTAVPVPPAFTPATE